jgi:hypothetical protein
VPCCGGSVFVGGDLQRCELRGHLTSEVLGFGLDTLQRSTIREDIAALGVLSLHLIE